MLLLRAWMCKQARQPLKIFSIMVNSKHASRFSISWKASDGSTEPKKNQNIKNWLLYKEPMSSIKCLNYSLFSTTSSTWLLSLKKTFILQGKRWRNSPETLCLSLSCLSKINYSLSCFFPDDTFLKYFHQTFGELYQTVFDGAGDILLSVGW